jgi:hypothetical protein
MCFLHISKENTMRHPFALILLALLPACSPSFQTSSGSDYLAARSFAGDNAAALNAIAATEPQLTFPARIGIARVVRGALTATPADEAALWDGLMNRTRGFGEFVPLSPLMAGLSGGSAPFDLDAARAMGARQHLDYILFVDVSGRDGVAQAAFVDVRNGYPYATAQAAVAGSEEPFYGWANRRNQQRQAQIALDMTTALIPQIEAMLTGLAARAE